MTKMSINVVKRDGSTEPLEVAKIHRAVEWACDGLDVSLSEVEMSAHLMLFDGIKTEDIQKALIQSAATLISVEAPQYTFVAARLLLQQIYKEVTGGPIEYPPLREYVRLAVSNGRLDPQLLDFDFDRLEAAIRSERDMEFTYLGLQTLNDRYFIRDTVKVGEIPKLLELPQHFWMRVAMGLAIMEPSDKTGWAISFYNILSKLEFLSSTPTLFNSGTLHSQLASCFLNTVADSIDAENINALNYQDRRYASIFGTIQECANLSKFAGGIGTDWTRVRSEGDVILSTNGKSSGVIPYLKIFNDTAVAVNQGGKRNGAFAAYLEPWHPDLYDFIDLRKNSGDERRRAHDIYPALWIPDLLMKRKENGGMWSFFSPHEYPELHDLYGEAFEKRYKELENEGKYRFRKPAIEVWRRIVTSLYETGHPWITFKDECNRRNPQDHAGVIHNSNLCTEITLNTSDEETAVCNIGSINVSRVKTKEDFARVVPIAMRMLDNVININFYPSVRALNANMKHRPVGLGIMGYAEWLVSQGIDWESEAHIEAADKLLEAVSYEAIKASMNLAKERGAYSSFNGSKWSKGILPIDTARDNSVSGDYDWEWLRREVITNGMRNSNTMAIAPTATIANIAGTTPTIELPYLRSYTKSNLSGSFLVVDPTLKYGRPELCKESFEVNQIWSVRANAARQKWIDQSQSFNIFVRNGVSGRDLDAIYTTAWELGCKTTYYLRAQAAELKGGLVEDKKAAGFEQESAPKACSIDNPDCESCQ